MPNLQVPPEQIPLFEDVPRTFVSMRSFVPVPAAQRPESKRIDWFRIITDVIRCGYAIQGIADEICVARTTIIGWRQGAEPRYSEGERLVMFWCKVTGESRSDLPMCSTSDWWAYHSKP